MNTRRRALRPFRALVAMLAIAACGGDGTTEPRTATRLDILSGGNQTGPVGAILAGTIVVRASDAEGPLSGVAITVASSGTGSGSASPASVTTGATGEAQVTWTLGSTIGTQTLTFSTTGVSPVSVTATGMPSGQRSGAKLRM